MKSNNMQLSKQLTAWLLVLTLAVTMLLCGCQEPAVQQTTLAPENCDNGHTDQDGNGQCDLCQENVVVNFQIYTVNDLHGKIADGDIHPGVDELTTFLKNARDTEENTIILSAGDMWQGSSESNMTRGNLTTEWMNDVGFDAMAMGNHEFDWGEEFVEANEVLADFPFLAINIYDRETDQRVDYCDSSTIVDLGEIQVGIIGAIGDCYTSIASDKVEDIYFKVEDELTALVMAESEALREQGAEFIVYVLHDGYGSSESGSVTNIMSHKIDSYYDVALSDGYVDLVFEAHTHQKYLLCDEYGVYHFQHKGENKGISYVKISYNTANGYSRIRESELIPTGNYANLDDDPIVEQLLEKYDEQIAPAREILGTNSAYRTGDEMRQLVADLYYEAGEAVWGDEYDIVLGGGFISVRNPWNLDKGEVTYGTLMSLFPFENDLVLCSILGSDLLSRFITTDNDNYFICYGDYGLSVRNSIDPDKTYYVVTDTYSSAYRYNRLTVVEEYEKGVYARDLLADYIRDGNLK